MQAIKILGTVAIPVEIFGTMVLKISGTVALKILHCGTKDH
jgi:hypothetical protein